MVQRCEHCGQAVIATDKQCWHCGRALSSGEHRPASAPQPATAVPDESASPIPSIRSILLYAGLTATLLLLLIATTRVIGQAPLFVANRNNIAPPGWQPFTDSRLQFTLNLPESWHLIDMTRAPEAPTLRSSPPLQAVVPTLDALVSDVQLLFLGAVDTAVFADGSPVFVLVANSRRLQQLPAAEVMGYVQAQLPENVTLSTVNQLEDSAANPGGSLLFNIEQDETLWRCLEQINHGEDSVYLVITCTSFAQFPRHESDFRAIMRSFQRLGP